MIGAKIALYAMIVLVACMIVTVGLRKTEDNKTLKAWVALAGLASLTAIPVGCIIQIWSLSSG